MADSIMTNNAPYLHIEIDGEQHKLQPAGEERGAPLSDLLRRAGHPLNTRCGGRGVCDGCRVDVVTGHVVQRDSGQAATGSIRACEHAVNGTETLLRVPPRSSLKHKPQIVAEYQICIPAAHDPIVHLHADELRLGRPLGAAVDIGTTTVAVMLVDLKTGQSIARTSRFNEQIHLGDDVVTRINLCMGNPAMLTELQHAVAFLTLIPLLEEAVTAARRSLADLRCITFAANTTMLHLLAGVDPTPMGVSPFTPAFLGHEIYRAGQILGDSPVPPNTPCHLLPGAAAYIGSDLTAGIVATGLIYEPGPSLLIDIGTNGEIILKHGNRLIGCATAAGPAFEGNRLSCGMRAVDGAISHVHIDGDEVSVDIIGGGQPVGICGSAYVDFLAQAHAAGVLCETGRFDDSFGSAVADRLMPWDDGHDVAFRLAWGRGKAPIVVTQRDIAALLQAKAAIAAGTLTLLDQFGLSTADITTVYLAGGFGTHLDRPAAIACGLLKGFFPQQIRAVGNTSLAGAYLALMDAGLLNEMSRAAQAVQIVELNLDPSFESRFIDQLTLTG
jgi:uncharacterized 2Fe-2S/4Fe-4S cluster protein (DUF4445 family)